MFFNRKKQEEFFGKLEEKFHLLEDGLQQSKKEAAEKSSQWEIISQNVTTLQSVIQKHDMAIEDLLEEWEEKRSDEELVQKQLSEYSKSEQQLLELFEAYQEQFFNLKRFAGAKDPAWTEQIALMEKALRHCQQLCGICIIEECGTEVDYDLHEVIEAVSTADSSKDKTIAAIYRCGYIYKGKVKRKAQVGAYRFETKEL